MDLVCKLIIGWIILSGLLIMILINNNCIYKLNDKVEILCKIEKINSDRIDLLIKQISLNDQISSVKEKISNIENLIK